MKGISGATGIAIGRVKLLYPADISTFIRETPKQSIDDEIALYKNGVEITKKYFTDICEKMSAEFSGDEAEIYEGYIEILTDNDVNKEIIDLIKTGNNSAMSATNSIYDQTIKDFQEMENEYFASRAQDICGIKLKLITAMNYGKLEESITLEDNSVIVAEDLSPADTAQLDMKKVAAFILEKGSKNSHVAIIARSLELPCVFGIDNICKTFTDGSPVIVDGFEAEVIENPSDKDIAKYKKAIKDFHDKQDKLKEVLTLPSCTSDGREIKLAMNACTIFEVTTEHDLHVDGIGLFRTEFIFMKEPDFPTADKQFTYYRDVAVAMKGKNCIFRLLDIGGDKPLHYAPYPVEANPFLGWRAIRYCFDHSDILMAQLQALVKASAFGKVSILIPMVSNMEEVLHIKRLIKEIKDQYKKDNIPYDADLEVGIMIETPSAVALSSDLAKEVDFFSIGTNDLVQYTLAVDRGNPKVSILYEEFHPSVVRMISQTVKSAHEAGKWVGVCGELASNYKATPLLIGLGVDELSMNLASIPYVKNVLRSLSFDKCKALADKVLTQSLIDDVKNSINYFLTENNIRM